MEHGELDEKLKRFDYSLCHPVREELKNRLLVMHRNEKKTSPWNRCLEPEELDMAAAAGIGVEKRPQEDEV